MKYEISIYGKKSSIDKYIFNNNNQKTEFISYNDKGCKEY